MQQDKKMYIAAGIFLGVGLLFLSVMVQKKSEDEHKVTFGKVESFRRDAIVKDRLQRQKVEVQNYMSAPSLSGSVRVVNDRSDESGLKLESSENNAVKDSARNDHNAMPTNALDSQMSKVLANRQKYDEMTQMQKKRFIEEYKRNALAKGYIIELDDKLNIIQYKRAPAAQKPYSVQMPTEVDQMEEDSDDSDD